MNEELDEIERVFLALSDKTRIKLVGLMQNGEVSVNFLCESLGVSQPKVSRHLAYLRSMGMVNTRRNGKWIYYRLAEPENRFGSRLLSDALGWIASLNRANPVAPANAPYDQIPVTTLRSENSNIYDETNINDKPDELEVYLL